MREWEFKKIHKQASKKKKGRINKHKKPMPKKSSILNVAKKVQSTFQFSSLNNIEDSGHFYYSHNDNITISRELLR